MIHFNRESNDTCMVVHGHLAQFVLAISLVSVPLIVAPRSSYWLWQSKFLTIYGAPKTYDLPKLEQGYEKNPRNHPLLSLM